MRTYNFILLSIVCVVVSFSAGIMLWSQPLSGDLTRISAYPERWFGWNDAQQDVPSLTSSERQPGKPHVLVVGDSFSEAGHWQALLGDKYSFSFIHNGRTTLARILALSADNKPDAIVIETAERAIPDMYGRDNTFVKTVDHCSLPSITNEIPANAGDISSRIAMLPTFRPVQRMLYPRSATNISEGFHSFKLYVKALISPRKRKAKPFSLTTSELFSNTRNDKILLLAKDFVLYDTIDNDNLDTVRCALKNTAAALVDAHIPYVIVTIPDKTTAYKPYLADSKISQRPSLIDRLQVNALATHGIDMLPPIRAMIAAGNRDVYLPNDTHWGYKGFQIAAVLIDKQLSAQLSENSAGESANHD